MLGCVTFCATGSEALIALLVLPRVHVCHISTERNALQISVCTALGEPPTPMACASEISLIEVADFGYFFKENYYLT